MPKLNFYNTIFQLQNHRRLDGTKVNDGIWILLILQKRDIELKIQNREKTDKTEKDEKLFSKHALT